MTKSIVFTGGGTGGHVFPGLAVIEILKRKGCSNISWLGSSTGMERDIVERSGIPFYGVPSGKLRRYFSLRNFSDIFKIIGGFISSFRILKKITPALLFSKGGFVSVPPVVAAYLLGIPVITHESDFDPGLATRINSRFAKTILTSFKATRGYFNAPAAEKTVLTGNPIRTAFEKGEPEEGKKFVGCPPDRKIILVLGGSQGSSLINNAILKIADTLLEKYFIVHQMGNKGFQKIEKTNYHGAPFFGRELPDILAAAALVISRAGSNTLWELAASGTPSILVPLSTAHSRGDQIRNARLFHKLGAAEVIREDKLDQNLPETLLQLLNNDRRLMEMKKKGKEIYKTGSAEKIAGIILDEVGEK